MPEKELRKMIAASPLARAAALPVRFRAVARHNAHEMAVSLRWLAKRREHTNYTYDLTPLNFEHMAWWVACVSGVQVIEARNWIEEVVRDPDLRETVQLATSASSRRRLADAMVLLGRRAAWYALIRALRPSHVVETGTDKGLGSIVIAAALLRNGVGRLTTIDIHPAAGYLISGAYAKVTTKVTRDSVEALCSLSDPVDFFIHDSDHSPEHEFAEYLAVEALLSKRALVISDNAHVTPQLARWSELNSRKFLFFDERPEGHWYPGAGIGASW